MSFLFEEGKENISLIFSRLKIRNYSKELKSILFEVAEGG